MTARTEGLLIRLGAVVVGAVGSVPLILLIEWLRG
jgi:hypothetical protein